MLAQYEAATNDVLSVATELAADEAEVYWEAMVTTRLHPSKDLLKATPYLKLCQ